MTTIQAKVPNYLARLAKEAAAKEQVSMDQIVSLALSAQISAWHVRDDIERRATRGQVRDLSLVLDKVRSVPPLEGDERI